MVLSVEHMEVDGLVDPDQPITGSTSPGNINFFLDELNVNYENLTHSIITFLIVMTIYVIFFLQPPFIGYTLVKDKLHELRRELPPYGS